MSKTIIDKEAFHNIVQGSYKCLRNKKKTGATKQSVINEMIGIIEKEIKDAYKKD